MSIPYPFSKYILRSLIYGSFLFFFTLNANAQYGQVHALQWSNEVVFQNSPRPLITGEGALSDSLSLVYNGTSFFESDGNYYAIRSWADYYYWFTKKYYHLFQFPDLYEFYYLTGNNLAMAKYISEDFYRGGFPAARLSIIFPVPTSKNDMSTHNPLSTKSKNRNSSLYAHSIHTDTHYSSNSGTPLSENSASKSVERVDKKFIMN